MPGVLYCPLCGAGWKNLTLIAKTSPGVKPAGEDWFCSSCGTFFTVSGVEKECRCYSCGSPAKIDGEGYCVCPVCGDRWKE